MTLLLVHLELIGLIQLRCCLARLQLCWRTRNHFRNRRAARDARLGAAARRDSSSEPLRALEAGLPVGHPTQNSESSDSDDEHGPGSLPSGFHDSLLGILGISARHLQTRRQYLCPTRQAVVGNEATQGSRSSGAGVELPTGGSQTVVTADEQATPSFTAEDGSLSASAANAETAPPPLPPAPLEISGSGNQCTVCLEMIKTGDTVRPLPKCSHVFHADCLERWAKYQQEKTKCPICRRPALVKSATEGTVSIASLVSNDSSSSESSGVRNSVRGARGSGEGSARRAPRSGTVRSGRPLSGRRQNAPARPARPVVRAPTQEAVARLQAFVGISEPFARAALEFTNSSADAAALLIFGHRGLLESFGESAEVAVSSSFQFPSGIVEALVQANPQLHGMEAQLGYQVGQLHRAGRLGAPPRCSSWSELDRAGKAEVFRSVLADINRWLEEAAHQPGQ